jgi:HK97 family phage prohead protease
MSSNHLFNTLVESHEVVLDSKEHGMGVVGLALPFDKVSRNGFRYITESIREAINTVIGAPALFNHDSEKVIGHIENASFDGQGMTYRMNLDEAGPYGWVANKVRRGDLKKVSIQCIYDEEKSFLDDEGVMNAWVKEFLEISVVTIPGFADTTAQAVEQFKSNLQGTETMSEEEQPKQDDTVETSEPQVETPAVEETPKEEEKPQEEVSKTEAVDDNEDEEQDDKKSSEEEEDRVGNLEKSVAELKALVTSMMKGKEAEDEEEEEPAEDKEKKVEEAIRNDKISISTEQLSEESIPKLSSADLKELYANNV